MIRTESEYRESVKRLLEARRVIASERKRFASERLTPAQINRVLEANESLVSQIESEVKTYKRLKKGEFEELRNLEGVGSLLTGLRIALGLSQRELAQRLDVHETQVSRDERNDYYGITVERLNRILTALGVELKTTVKHLPTPLRKSA